MTAGRPTLYRKSYCKKIIEFAKQGKLPLEWAVELGVGKNTMAGWKPVHKEFSVAYDAAMTIAEVQHDKEYDRLVTSPEVTKWKFRHGAIFHNSESQRIEQNITGDMNHNVTLGIDFVDRVEIDDECQDS